VPAFNAQGKPPNGSRLSCGAPACGRNEIHRPS
jgi:hypothetical protein